MGEEILLGLEERLLNFYGRMLKRLPEGARLGKDYGWRKTKRGLRLAQSSFNGDYLETGSIGVRSFPKVIKKERDEPATLD